MSGPLVGTPVSQVPFSELQSPIPFSQPSGLLNTTGPVTMETSSIYQPTSKEYGLPSEKK